MNAYTQPEEAELTPDEHAAIELSLRKRKIALADRALSTEKICLMTELQLEYKAAGYAANAEALEKKLSRFA